MLIGYYNFIFRRRLEFRVVFFYSEEVVCYVIEVGVNVGWVNS